MNDCIETPHGTIALPAFFPTVGWPGGEGEYVHLFSNLEYFCRKINHYHFLFNFSSFILGWTIPPRDFNTRFESFRGKDIRKIVKDHTPISSSIVNDLIILLDIGGNRIFNKIIYDNLPATSVASYGKYLSAYEQFLRTGQPDIFVSFDIGPSYTTRNEISYKGIRVWESLSRQARHSINRDLLDISIRFKNTNALIMVPINAVYPEELRSNLEYLYEHHRETIDIVGIAGIANKSTYAIKQALETVSTFKEKTKWNIKTHGLGLGGWGNMPLLIKYGIDSCDVASPWRRACTDAISEPYFPLLDKHLNFVAMPNSFSHKELYNDIYSKIKCACPFCEDLPMKELRERCKKADKRYTGKSLHDTDFREMRIRVYFHNVYQHIALLKKLYLYKIDYGQGFMRRFIEDMPTGLTRSKFSRLLI